MPASVLENRCVVSSSDCSTGEAQLAVDALLTSNENADNRTSDSTLKRENTTLSSSRRGYTKVRSRNGKNTKVRTRKGGSTSQRSKKRKRPSNAETGGTATRGVFNTDEFAEEADILKCMGELKPELEFSDGSQLNSELEKSSFMCDESYFMNYNFDDFFKTNLCPEDIFSFDI